MQISRSKLVCRSLAPSLSLTHWDAGWEPWLESAPDARETTTHFSSRKKGGAAADALFRVHLSREAPAVPEKRCALCSLWLNLHLIIRGGAAPLFRPPDQPKAGCRKLVFLIPGRRHLFD
jgi:hypothetical protein